MAMRNEALCKIICHNICCLIQSMFELGVEATYWMQAGEADPKTVGTAMGNDEVEALAWI